MHRPLTFRRRNRIRRSGDFDAIRKGERRVFSRTAVMNWQPSASPDHSRLGLIVSKRGVGNRAVDRNTARRRLKEAFRRLQPRIRPPVDMVLIARPPIRESRQCDVDRDLRHLLRRIGHLAPSP